MTALTINEETQLAYYEDIIERGRLVFFQVGLALVTIRDERLYRGTHATFEAYCQERWGFSRQYAHLLVQASDVIENILPDARADLSTMVDKGQIPANERQARPLAKLPADQQGEAWQTAVATAPGGKVTAKHVQEVVAQYLIREPALDESEETFTDSPPEVPGPDRPDTWLAQENEEENHFDLELYKRKERLLTELEARPYDDGIWDRVAALLSE